VTEPDDVDDAEAEDDEAEDSPEDGAPGSAVRPPDAWDLVGRDTAPDLTAKAGPSDVGSALLLAMLNSEGMPWKAPYEPVRKALKIRKKSIIPELEEQANQRLRTWLLLFRHFGLVYPSDGLLSVTELGRQLCQVLEETYASTDDYAKQISRANRLRIARVVGPALARWQLRNPLTAELYPPDTDIHPLWAIWKAARRLDNKIHWDELDRTLTKCMQMTHLDDSIARIREARSTPDYDPDNKILMEEKLGPRRPVVGGAVNRLERNQRDRVIIWLQQAAFHDIFLEQSDRADGYRHVNEEFVGLLDELLKTPPENFDPTRSSESYFEWVGQASPLVAEVTQSPFMGSDLLRTVLERCRQFGDSRIISLVGAAGTGKTALAREAALTLADSDTTRVEVVQFHAAFTYEEFIGGLAPVGDGFAPSEGVLVAFNELAVRNPEKTHVLVIDEISRADMANVLGELLTYVEYRDRSFTIPALGRSITLAPNLVIIATMNPADRSVINMDDALVRRLRQITVPRSTGALRKILSGNGMADELREEVCAWFEHLPDDAPFGHGLFVDVADEQDLYRLWHEQLVFFLRRGGVSVYPEPETIENRFVWRSQNFSTVPEVAGKAPDILYRGQDTVVGVELTTAPEETAEHE
jgi:5-methylcytosine-specific restriction protein B